MGFISDVCHGRNEKENDGFQEQTPAVDKECEWRRVEGK